MALAGAGRGHLLLLGVLLAAVVATRLGAVASLVATVAVTVRWGGPSLAAVAGGQAVLGPAITLGSTAAALSAGLAAAALVLVAPRTPALALAMGVVAGSLAVGPELPHDLAVRLVGAGVACVLALAVRWVPFRQGIAVVLAVAAVAAAA